MFQGFQHFQYVRHPETAVSVACSSPYEEKGKEREDVFLSFSTLGGRRAASSSNK